MARRPLTLLVSAWRVPVTVIVFLGDTMCSACLVEAWGRQRCSSGGLSSAVARRGLSVVSARRVHGGQEVRRRGGVVVWWCGGDDDAAGGTRAKSS